MLTYEGNGQIDEDFPSRAVLRHHAVLRLRHVCALFYQPQTRF